MTNTARTKRINLQEATTTNRAARQVVAGLSYATPAIADIWRYLDTALADTPALATEIRRLRAQLARTRLSHANLAAAALATFAARREGEADPLMYVRDELQAQGYDPEQGRA
jgi:hypothetical protein